MANYQDWRNRELQRPPDRIEGQCEKCGKDVYIRYRWQPAPGQENLIGRARGDFIAEQKYKTINGKKFCYSCYEEGLEKAIMDTSSKKQKENKDGG